MHLPYRLTDSETKCPADHRRRATEIVPVRSSGIERGARRGERGSWEKPHSPANAGPLRRPARLAVCSLGSNRSAGSALGVESSRLRGFLVKANSWRYS
jgi:hypothetical protein